MEMPLVQFKDGISVDYYNEHTSLFGQRDESTFAYNFAKCSCSCKQEREPEVKFDPSMSPSSPSSLPQTSAPSNFPSPSSTLLPSNLHTPSVSPSSSPFQPSTSLPSNANTSSPSVEQILSTPPTVPSEPSSCNDVCMDWVSQNYVIPGDDLNPESKCIDVKSSIFSRKLMNESEEKPISESSIGELIDYHNRMKDLFIHLLDMM